MDAHRSMQKEPLTDVSKRKGMGGGREREKEVSSPVDLSVLAAPKVSDQPIFPTLGKSYDLNIYPMFICQAVYFHRLSFTRYNQDFNESAQCHSTQDTTSIVVQYNFPSST